MSRSSRFFPTSKLFSEKSGRRSLGFLISGTTFAQGVQFLASLVLTRLYAPSEFGEYASILAIANVLGVLLTLSYQNAIPLASSDEESRIVAWLAMTIAAIVALASTAILGIFVSSGLQIAGWRPSWQGMVFIPFTAWAIGMWSILQLRQSRSSRFHQVALATGMGSLTQAGTQLGLGLAGAAWGGLGAGYLLGRLVNAATLLRGARLGRPPSVRRMLQMGATWSTMPTWVLPPAILNLMGTVAMTPWVAYTFGLPTAGLFAFAYQMLSVPAALLGQSVATILFPRFADGERAGGIHRSELDRCIVGLAAISVPMFIPVIVLGPQIFSLVFGQSWEEAGQIAAILAPWVAVSFISSPVSSLALVKRRFRMITLIGVIETSVRFSAIAIGGVAGSQFLGIGLFALVGIAISINYVAWVSRLTGGSLWAVVMHYRWWCGMVLVSVPTLVLAQAVLPLTLVVPLTVAVCLGFLISASRLLLADQES